MVLLRVQTTSGELRYGDTAITLAFATLTSPALDVVEVRNADFDIVGRIQLAEFVGYGFYDITTISEDDQV